MSTLHGSCLCGVVAFAVDGRYSEIDHCHCWKCRKVSGSNSNAVLLTSSRSLRWERGAEFVKTYRMDDGWQSVFCAACGSPLPLLGADGKLYWVPAGSLDDDPGVGVAQHIHVQGKGSWEVIGGDAPQFDHEPPPAPPSESGDDDDAGRPDSAQHRPDAVRRHTSRTTARYRSPPRSTTSPGNRR